MLTTDVSLFWHISCNPNDFNDLNSNKRIEISLLNEEIVVQLVNSHSHSKENAEAMKKERTLQLFSERQIWKQPVLYSLKLQMQVQDTVWNSAGFCIQ